MLQTENKSFLASLEELISSLDGVYSSKVVLSKDQVPEEIHLLASDKKSPKTITRDVQSALMAVFGVNIDYRIISIAQVPPKMSQKGSAWIIPASKQNSSTATAKYPCFFLAATSGWKGNLFTSGGSSMP